MNVSSLPASAFVLAVKLTVVRELQYWKAQSETYVTDEGIVIEAREVQREKACIPMKVKDEDSVTEINEVQP